MTSNSNVDELEVLRKVDDALTQVGPEERERILAYVIEKHDISLRNGPRQFPPPTQQLSSMPSRDADMRFSDRPTQSPKDFLHEKQPSTDIERMACLAYYLCHNRDTPHFKTLDISKLNTEAAQIKFSNPAQTVRNATNAGLLASAGKGKKLISAIGERFVDALPDRDLAKSEMHRSRGRRTRKKNSATRKAESTSRK